MYHVMLIVVVAAFAVLSMKIARYADWRIAQEGRP